MSINLHLDVEALRAVSSDQTALLREAIRQGGAQHARAVLRAVFRAEWLDEMGGPAEACTEERYLAGFDGGIAFQREREAALVALDLDPEGYVYGAFTRHVEGHEVPGEAQRVHQRPDAERPFTRAFTYVVVRTPLSRERERVLDVQLVRSPAWRVLGEQTYEVAVAGWVRVLGDGVGVGGEAREDARAHVALERPEWHDAQRVRVLGEPENVEVMVES